MKNFTQSVFTLLLFSLIGTTVVQAQTRNGGITWGFHGGATLFKLSNLDHFDPDFTTPSGLEVKSRAGFMAGVSVTIPFTKSLSLQPEFNFQAQGAKLHYQGSVGDIAGVGMDDRYRLYYLQIPVLAQYRIPATSLHVYVGPQVGYLVHAKYTHQMQDYERSSQGITDQLQRFDFAGVYGLAYHFPVENSDHAVVLSARYTSGFSSVFKSDYSFLDQKSRNQGLVLSVGFKF